MNKKLKKMLAAVSAVAVCAVSMTSMVSGAVEEIVSEELTPYTTSFKINGVKYQLWEEATDYYNCEDFKVYISEPIEDTWYISNVISDENKYLIEPTYHKTVASYHQIYQVTYTGEWCDVCDTGSLVFAPYVFDNEDDVNVLENYLLKNNIEYNVETYEDKTYISLIKMNVQDHMQKLIDIKEDIGFAVEWRMSYGSGIKTDVVNALPEDTLSGDANYDSEVTLLDDENVLPEVTLAGDANEDNEVTISDAVLISQTIVNPDEFKMTMQGMANADVAGDSDGITLNDALAIQEMCLNK